MEKPHAVIPIETYDELKANKLILEQKELELESLIKKYDRLDRGIRMLVYHYMNNVDLKPKNPIEILSGAGIELSHPYAGSKDLGPFIFI